MTIRNPRYIPDKVRATSGLLAARSARAPEARFIKAPGLDKQNLPLSAGMQFFGDVRIDGTSGGWR